MSPITTACSVALLVFFLLGAGAGAGTSKGHDLRIATHGLVSGQKVVAPVRWQVNVSGGTPTRVEFFVDGRLRWTERERPYRFNGDAGLFSAGPLSSGRHILKAVAYAPAGSTAVTITVFIPEGSRLPARLGISHGGRFFVDGKRGKDTNRGSVGSPWRTIARAWQSVPRAGSVINVRGGTYEGQINLAHRTMSPASPITVRAYPGEHVVLSGPRAAGLPAVYIWRSSGVRLEGFEITNDAGDGIKVDSGSDIEIVGNDIHDVGQQGIIVGAGTGTTRPTYSRNVQIWSNRIHHNGGWWDDNNPYALVGTHGIYYGNTGSNSDGVQHGAVGGVIANNLFYDQPTGFHIQVGSQNDGLIITNNTFDGAYQPNAAAGNAIQLYGESNQYATKNTVVANNVIANSAHRGVYGSGPTMQGNIVLHNLVFNNPLGNLVSTIDGTTLFTIGPGNIDRDPRFVDRTARNYRPAAGSPLIGRADPAYAPTHDITGVKRDSRPDIGAFERKG